MFDRHVVVADSGMAKRMGAPGFMLQENQTRSSKLDRKFALSSGVYDFTVSCAG
jgi:hypothetical protein